MVGFASCAGAGFIAAWAVAFARAARLTRYR
jgi:hypothetical protein